MRTPTTKNTKFEHIEAVLRKRIVNGDLRPGDRLPSFGEMQIEFDTTPATINRALISLAQQSLVTRQQGRGIYVSLPNAPPKTRVIGLLGLGGKDEYYSLLQEGVNSIAVPGRFQMMIVNWPGENWWQGLDGAIIHSEWGKGILDEIPPGFPLVGLMTPCEYMTSVVADDFHAGVEAGRHLAVLGHTKLSSMMYLGSKPSELRLAGVRLSLHLSNATLEDRAVKRLDDTRGDDLFEVGHKAMTKWIGAGWPELRSTAVVVQNDASAIGAIKALQEAGYRVPDDVSVVGFDNSTSARYGQPSLTTVDIPLEKIARRAAELLLRQIDGEPQANEIISLPTRLIARQSTAIASKQFAL